MQCDFVVVGSGSAGSAVAAALSADGRHRVVLLEAGPDRNGFWIRTPLGYGHSLRDPDVNWMYESEPVPGLGGRTNYYPRGKLIGGSSAINAMAYVRGQKADFDDWEAAGNPGWGWDAVAAAYRRMESHPIADEHHGQDGPVQVGDRSEVAYPPCATFIATGEALGLPRSHDFNGASLEGVGYYHHTIHRGERVSAARAWLDPARRRPNLTVLAEAQATAVLFDGRRAVGVAYRRGGAGHRVTAAREVVVCAGAINSPQLLLLSGLGPAAELARLGIATVADLPAVGCHMQDHLCHDFGFRARVPTWNQALGPWRGKLAAGLRYLITRSGPLSTGSTHAGGFFRTDPGRPAPNMQLYFSPLSYDADTPGIRRLPRPDPWNGFQISVSHTRPRSRGAVRLASPDPLAAPAIQPDFLSDPADLDELVDAVAMIGRLAGTAPLAGLVEGRYKPPPETVSREAIAADLRARAYSVYHPCGTCRMGPDRHRAVVDHRLKVHGVDGLRVIDASVFPNITSGNINAPAMMVGLRGGEIVAADHA